MPLFQIAVLAFSAALGLGGCARPSVARKSAELGSVNEQAPAKPLQSNPSMALKLPSRGIRNFGQVTPTLYRGGQPSPAGWRNLAKMGVNIVVDLRVTGRAHERAEVTKLGMRYIEIPWMCYNPKDSDVARFFAVLQQNPGKKIFVHCATGDDRTGMEIAAYRMAEQGWTAQQARKEMEAFGFGFVHQRICPRLGAYETNFPKRLATSPVFQDLRAQNPTPDQAPAR